MMEGGGAIHRKEELGKGDGREDKKRSPTPAQRARSVSAAQTKPRKERKMPKLTGGTVERLNLDRDSPEFLKVEEKEKKREGKKKRERRPSKGKMEMETELVIRVGDSFEDAVPPPSSAQLVHFRIGSSPCCLFGAPLWDQSNSSFFLPLFPP